MKKLNKLLLVLIIVMSIEIDEVFATPVNSSFVDDEFYKCVVDSYNINNGNKYDYDVNLTDDELMTITRLSCSSNNYKITDVIGLNKLENLEYLDLGIFQISSINVSNNKKLTFLSIQGNGKTGNLTSIDVSNNLELKSLQLPNNNLETIDVSKNVKLELLTLYGNPINTIDVSNNINLQSLDLISARLSSIDLSNNKELTSLRTNGNMKTIDVSNNLKLTRLEVKGGLEEIDLSKNEELTELTLSMNNLTEIDLSKNPKLTKVDLSSNKLTQDNIKLINSIKTLGIFGNNIETIDLRNYPYIDKLYYSGISKNKNATLILNSNVTITSYYKTNLFTNSTDDEIVQINNNQFVTLKEGTSELSISESNNVYKLTVIVDDSNLKEDDGFVDDTNESENIPNNSEGNTSEKNDEIIENPKTGNSILYISIATLIISTVVIIYYIKFRKISEI